MPIGGRQFPEQPFTCASPFLNREGSSYTVVIPEGSPPVQHAQTFRTLEGILTFRLGFGRKGTEFIDEESGL